jgi:hypothetical protein
MLVVTALTYMELAAAWNWLLFITCIKTSRWECELDITHKKSRLLLPAAMWKLVVEAHLVNNVIFDALVCCNLTAPLYIETLTGGCSDCFTEFWRTVGLVFLICLPPYVETLVEGRVHMFSFLFLQLCYKPCFLMLKHAKKIYLIFSNILIIISILFFPLWQFSQKHQLGSYECCLYFIYEFVFFNLKWHG